MTITDPVHGSIPLTSLQKDLIQTVEVQRLNMIHQLGMTFHVYPGAHSMRFAHALGVSHLARMMSGNLVENNPSSNLSASDRCQITNLVTAAALLHDIGHTPWSHTLEPLLVSALEFNHMELTRQLITGTLRMPVPGSGRIPDILRDHGLDPADVADLINQCYRGPRYIQQMIYGEVDADMLDYLSRDFTSTGVSFGHIDIDRLMQIMMVYHDRIAFQDKGLPAVRDFLNARVEMYSAVYLHKKTRIADLMFLRAASESILKEKEFKEFWCMTDDELLSKIMTSSKSELARDLAWRIKYRQSLFKRVFCIGSGRKSDMEKGLICRICALQEEGVAVCSRIEQAIVDRIDMKPGYVIADLVATATDLSEQRFKELDILFVDKYGAVFTIQELDSNFAGYIAKAKPSPALFSIYVPEEKASEAREILPELIEFAGL